MPSRRTERVADLVCRETASIIQRDLKDPRIGILTVTGAEVSPDLHLATVFYSVLGDADKRKEASAALSRAKGFIRRELGARLKLKNTPEIRFVYDETLDRGMRIEELLGKTHGPAKTG